MSYIGSTPTTQSFIAGTDSFNGTGSATNFTLSRFVNSTNDIQVVVNNVVQYPPNYSVSGTTLTISPAPSAGTNNVYVRYLSTTLQSITIPGGSSVVGNFGLSGNLQFLGSAQRITGDFGNTTFATRVFLQSSTGTFTDIGVLAPSTSTQSSAWTAYLGNDPTNTSRMRIISTSAEGRVEASITGTGTYLPMTFFTGGSKQAEITTAGLFQFNSGYGSVATAYGCRAWVNFNGTGTVAILASGNVSSITDRAVGQYTVNFATAMPDANYASLGTHNAVGGDVSCTFIGNASYGAANTASAATVNTTTFSALTDASRIYVAIFR
jgi:hypothetical protein